MLEVGLTCRMVLTGDLLQVPLAPWRGAFAMGQGCVKISRNTSALTRQDKSVDL